MNPIERNINQIAEACRRFQVRRLEVFGSILRADFDPQNSDADFLVEFDPVPASVKLENYLGLRYALTILLSRPVDLVESDAIRNPYILKNLAEEKQLLYAA